MPAGAQPPRDERRPLACDPNALSFFIVASDQDLLRQVRSSMQSNGMVGIADTAGRLHYLVDGSRGAPFAARRILEMANRCHAEKDSQLHELELLLPEAIDRVLDRIGIRHELKGRSYLQYILFLAALDERKLKPLSKTLYPDVARHFKARSSQVERDIRYTFSCASPTESWPKALRSGNTARISFLCSEVQRELRRMIPEAGPDATPAGASLSATMSGPGPDKTRTAAEPAISGGLTGALPVQAGIPS